MTDPAASELVLEVFVVALATDLATGLGALPLATVRRLSPHWQGIAYALAAGMMVSASVFGLAEQGLRKDAVWEIVAGLIAGGGFFWQTAKLVDARDWNIADLGTKDSRQAALIILTMFIHSIPEGVAIGVGYGTGEYRFGLLLAVAIAIHNIPEGLAISLPLRAKGVSTTRCALYAIFSSLPQPVAAVPAFLLVWFFQPLLPLGLGFAGGAMIFLAIAELVPESLTLCRPRAASWGFLVGLVLMLMLTAGLDL